LPMKYLLLVTGDIRKKGEGGTGRKKEKKREIRTKALGLARLPSFLLNVPAMGSQAHLRLRKGKKKEKRHGKKKKRREERRKTLMFGGNSSAIIVLQAI